MGCKIWCFHGSDYEDLWRHVIWQLITTFSEESATSVFSLEGPLDYMTLTFQTTSSECKTSFFIPDANDSSIPRHYVWSRNYFCLLSGKMFADCLRNNAGCVSNHIRFFITWVPSLRFVICSFNVGCFQRAFLISYKLQRFLHCGGTLDSKWWGEKPEFSGIREARVK